MCPATALPAPQSLPRILLPWLPEDREGEEHEFSIPRSFALWLLRIGRRYPSVESMFVLGLNPRHHGLRVFYTDGTATTFATVDDVLCHWATIGWHPPVRC
jgi:hypothetical protein